VEINIIFRFYITKQFPAMKSTLCRTIPLISILLLAIPGFVQAQTNGYRSPESVGKWAQETVAAHQGKARLEVIANSPGGRPVYLLEIGNEIGSQDKLNPSIFVGSNLEGTRPLATEAAIFLAEMILDDPSHYDSLNWYIIPVGNPDAADHYFQKPLYEETRNDLPTNDDRDESTDEDGVNDLNQDGWITQMRVKDPDGIWIQSEEDPRLMRKADPEKGEKGVYKLFTEGTDEDGDGLYNEDGPGGTNVNLNFPFLFQNFTETGGKYAGSTPESYAVMEFVFSHPDIAMIFSFGSTNFCLTPPKGGRKGEADLNRIRVTERQARMFDLDPSRTYSMNELLTIVRAAYPGEQFDESDIAGFLGLGAAVNPQEGDLVFYKKYAEEFKSYLKDLNVVTERFEPGPAAEGSMELWGYFHVGVPVFSMDLWGVPKPAGDTASQKRPGPQKNSDETEETGGLDKELAILSYSDSVLNKQGFVAWQYYDHPSLGQVEIGGFVPYVSTVPPYSQVESILANQVPWVLNLAGELPTLHIYDAKVLSLGEGVFQLEVWVENRSFIPFPTAMGNRNKQPAPAVLILEGDNVNLLSGNKRTPVRSVKGMSRVKLKWVLQTDNAVDINLSLESKTTGRDHQSIKIGG
jgi:hypothetical protein